MSIAARRRWSVGLVVGAVAFGAHAFVQARDRPVDAATRDVTVSWLLGIACLLIVAVIGGAPHRRERWSGRIRRWRPTPYDVAGALILLVAALARLVVLHRFPTVIDSDEGIFLTQAYRARHGAMPNPWGTGVLTAADGYYALEGRLSLIFGSGIAAYRVLSAVLGIVTVLAVWRLGRRVLGETAGLVAMGIVSFLPLHLWASRSALNNVSHAAVAAVLLWLLDRAILRRRRGDAVAAGIVIGLGAYGYVGGAVFLVVALAVLVAVAVLPAFEVGVRGAGTIAGWVLLSSVVVAAPLLGHYVANPDRLYGRAQQVDGAVTTAGGRAAAIVAGSLFPLLDRHGAPADFYRVDGPFLGWIVGPLAVAGIVVWLWWTIRRWRSGRGGVAAPAFRCEPLLVAWFVLTAVVSQTEGMSSQRWLAVTPLWALSAAAALVAAGRFLEARTELRRSMLVVAGAVLIGGVAMASAARFFDEGQQRRAYGDHRTAGAYDLGWRLAAGDPDVRVLSLGLPFQPYSAFGNLRFQFPRWEQQVVEIEPLDVEGSPGVPAPVLAPGEVAVIAAERIATDWCPVFAANPDATFAESRDRYGAVLYLLAVRGPRPIPAGPSPASTTLHDVEVRC